MLDTCIYAVKNRPASVPAALRANESAGIGISSVSVAELCFGAEKSGSPQIAAHALAPGVSLVTNSIRECSRVPGLRLENWVGATP